MTATENLTSGNKEAELALLAFADASTVNEESASVRATKRSSHARVEKRDQTHDSAAQLDAARPSKRNAIATNASSTSSQASDSEASSESSHESASASSSSEGTALQVDINYHNDSVSVRMQFSAFC